MNNIFQRYLVISVSGMILAGIVWSVIKIGKKYVSKKRQYYIWLLVVLRLLLPFGTFPGILGTYFPLHIPTENDNLYEDGVSVIQKENIIEEDSAAEIQKETLAVKAAEPVAANSIHFVSYLKEYFWMLWVISALILFIKKIIGYLKYMRFIRAGSFFIRNSEIEELLENTKKELHIRRKILLYHNSLIASPMLIGCFKPSIILPDLSTESKNFKHVFLHELTHYKRKDILYKWLVQSVVCLYWYNPLLYLLSREIEKACELSCDEVVLERLNGQEQRQYGETLLSCLKETEDFTGGVITMTFGKNARILKERLGAIMIFKRVSKGQRIVSSLLTVSLLAAGIGIGCIAAETEALAKPKEVFAEDNSHIEVANGSYTNKNGKIIYSFANKLIYVKPYIFELQWSSKKDSIAYVEKVKINDTLSVAFNKETAAYAKDQKALDAVKTAAIQFSKNKKFQSTDGVNVVLTKVKGPYKKSASQLAKDFYSKDNIAYFAAVVKDASEDVITELAERIYKDENITSFACISSLLTPEQVEKYAELAYKDENITFFACVSDALTSKQVKKYAKRAYKEDNIVLFSIIADNLSNSQKKEFLKLAKKDYKTNFYYVLED